MFLNFPTTMRLRTLYAKWTMICNGIKAFNRILDFSNGLDFYLGFFFLITFQS